jgi:hypothetical protein
MWHTCGELNTPENMPLKTLRTKKKQNKKTKKKTHSRDLGIDESVILKKTAKETKREIVEWIHLVQD